MRESDDQRPGGVKRRQALKVIAAAAALPVLSGFSDEVGAQQKPATSSK